MSGKKVLLVVMVLVSVLIAGCTAVQIYPVGNTLPTEKRRSPQAHTTAYIIKGEDVWFCKDSKATKVVFAEPKPKP